MSAEFPVTYLVTGAAGFIGSRVVRQLAARGNRVVCPHRPGSPPEPDLPGEHLEADLLEDGNLAEIFEPCDVVVHLAARSGGIQFQQARQDDVLADNLAMTRAVLSAAVSRPRRVFLASSAVVYSHLAESPIAEDAPLVSPSTDSVTGYAWSKVTDELLGSWYGEAHSLDVVVGRFTGVYGPGGSFDTDHSTVVHGLIRRAVESGDLGHLEVWGDGTAVRSFVHVDDVARAVLAVLDRGTPAAAYNIDSGDAVSIAQLAELVRDTVDPSLQLRFDPSKPQGVHRRVLDNRRLRSLRFAPEVSLRDGIAATVKAYRQSVAA